MYRRTESGISVDRKEPVSVKAPTDDSDCYIVGLDVTEDGRIIVADLANKNVKLFELDGTWLMSRSLSARPAGYNAVAVLNNEEALLYIRPEGMLHILDLKHNILETKYTVSIKTSLLSICCYQGQIFATSGVGVPSVMKMDKIGTVMWSRTLNNTGQRLFKSPFFATCFQDGDRLTVLVSDDGNRTITSLDGATGDILKILSIDNKRSVGPTAYGLGRVHIWNPEGKEIDVWTTNLENKTRVISDLEHVVCGCMKYCEIGNYLLLTYGWFSPNPNAIVCYKLRSIV